MQVEFDENCPFNSAYRDLLTTRVKYITKRLKKNFSDVVWIIYDPEKPPAFDAVDATKIALNRQLCLDLFDVPSTNKYGFSSWNGTKRSVYISIRMLNGGGGAAAVVGFDDYISEPGLNLLTEVIIHELAHIETGIADHNSQKFKSVLDSFTKQCTGL